MINKFADKVLFFYEKQGYVMDFFQSFMFIIAFLSFFPPRMLLIIDVYMKVDLYVKLIMAAYVYIIALCYLIRYRKLPLLIIGVNLYCGFLFVSTCFNHGDLKTAIWGNWIIITAMVLLIWNSMERNPDWCLRTMWFVYYAAILFNFYCVFEFWKVGKGSKSLEETFFFGNYNGFIQWFLPAQVIGYVIWKKSQRIVDKVLYLVLCIINIVAIFYVKSSTSMVVMVLFSFYMLLLNKRITRKIFNIYVYIIGNILFFISIVILRIQNGAIAYIAHYFKTNMTFSSRTLIWDKAVNSIKAHVLFGVGIEPMDLKKNQLIGFGSVHNMGLEILYTGGIIAMLLFAAMVVIVIIKIRKAKMVDYCIVGCFSAFLGSYFLAAQFESHTIMVSVICFAIVYFVLDAFERARFQENI